MGSPENHRDFVLYVSDRIAGRFTTFAAAADEEERLCRLALKNGRAVTTRICEETQPHGK